MAIIEDIERFWIDATALVKYYNEQLEPGVPGHEWSNAEKVKMHIARCEVALAELRYDFEA